MDKDVLELSVTHPFSYFDIDPIYTRCRTLYWPKQKAIEKCIIILETAQSFAISPLDAFYMQFEIDFVLL